MRDGVFLVTGGSGYIGSEVVFQLVNLGHRIIIVDLSPPVIKSKSITYIKHDLSKPLPKKKITLEANAVVHLAALVGGIEFANENPALILRSNMLIDINTITLASEMSVSRFLYVSSSLVYEKSTNIPYTEDQTESLLPPS